MALTLPGLKPAVAAGGMDCDTVVDAATDAALDVVCALATAARTEAAMMDRESILMDVMVVADGE